MNRWFACRSLLFVILIFVFTSPLRAYRIVIVGDSHSDFLSGDDFGIFSKRLLKILADNKYETSLYAASGSIPDWRIEKRVRSTQPLGATVVVAGKKPSAPEFVPHLTEIFAEQESPVDLVVIEQGTNLLDPKRKTMNIANAKQIGALVQALSRNAKALLWVGAPRYPDRVYKKEQQDNLSKAIEENMKGENRYVYDSRFQPNLDTSGKIVFVADFKYCPRVYKNKEDPEHLCLKAAEAWATGVGMMIDYIHNRTEKQ
jgi:hypothetical protein